MENTILERMMRKKMSYYKILHMFCCMLTRLGWGEAKATFYTHLILLLSIHLSKVCICSVLSFYLLCKQHTGVVQILLVLCSPLHMFGPYNNTLVSSPHSSLPPPPPSPLALLSSQEELYTVLNVKGNLGEGRGGVFKFWDSSNSVYFL